MPPHRRHPGNEVPTYASQKEPNYEHHTGDDSVPLLLLLPCADLSDEAANGCGGRLKVSPGPLPRLLIGMPPISASRLDLRGDIFWRQHHDWQFGEILHRVPYGLELPLNLRQFGAVIASMHLPEI